MKLMRWMLCLTLACLLTLGAFALAEALELPADLTTIQAEAFMGDRQIKRVVLPEGIREIGARAFANSGVVEISLPVSLEKIADDAFQGCPLKIVRARKDTHAAKWAKNKGYEVVNLTVAFSQVGQESEWRDENTESISSAIKGHKGWEFVYSDGMLSKEVQIAALRDFIRQKVDYILLTAVEVDGWDEVLREVNDAKIPLILIDRMPDCLDKIEYAAAFNSDFELEGRRQIQWAGEYLKKQGRDSDVKVAILQGPVKADADIGRTSGNLEAVKDYPFMEVVAKKSAGFTRDGGEDQMAKWLKAGEKIDVLIAHNDEMALGAIEAVEKAGLKPGEDILIVGCDCISDALKAIADGAMNCSVECSPLYGPAVEAFIQRLEAGETFDKLLIHPAEGLVDRDGGIKVEGATSVKAATRLG